MTGRVSRMSSKVGTITYASPEQLNSTQEVSASTDIYSLGVILFEMIIKFRTQHERSRCIENLKSTGSIDPTVEAQFGWECGLIRRMIHKTPSERPSASQLLEYIKQHEMEQQKSIEEIRAHLNDPKGSQPLGEELSPSSGESASPSGGTVTRKDLESLYATKRKEDLITELLLLRRQNEELRAAA